MNRLRKGEDGKVPYERSRGKKPTVLGVEFGEKVLYKIPKRPKMEKIEPRWKHGIFVEVKRKSGELMVARPEGIVYVRAAKRIRMDKRWGDDCVNWVQWAPWHRYKDAAGSDGDVPEGVGGGQA